MKRKLDNGICGCLVWICIFVFWIINLIQFCNCDFEAPFKKEIVKGVGIFIPPTSIVTVWINPSEESTKQ
jgi:hypothetical protein